jgi:hypothetical protein
VFSTFEHQLNQKEMETKKIDMWLISGISLALIGSLTLIIQGIIHLLNV